MEKPPAESPPGASMVSNAYVRRRISRGILLKAGNWSQDYFYGPIGSLGLRREYWFGRMVSIT